MHKRTKERKRSGDAPNVMNVVNVASEDKMNPIIINRLEFFGSNAHKPPHYSSVRFNEIFIRN